MKKIDGYISELLFKHDCVILPGFGGFITSYAPASIHPTRHTLYPPSKDILFNARLQRNDGLLANHIAETENITYDEAVMLIQQFTSDCQTALQANQAVVFDQIGTFIKNAEGNLEFLPSGEVNYLEEAYGLTKLVSPPVTKEYKKTKSIPDTGRKTNVSQRIQRKTILRMAYAFILLAVMGTWSYYNSPLLKDIYTNYSGIIPLIRATHESPKISEEIAATVQTDIKAEIPSSPSENLLSNNESVPEVVVTTPPSLPVSNVNYYIIAGAFKDPVNASTMLNQLISKGFDARMAGRTKGGLYRVCYEVFIQKDQALHALESIHQQEDTHAWLLIE